MSLVLQLLRSQPPRILRGGNRQDIANAAPCQGKVREFFRAYALEVGRRWAPAAARGGQRDGCEPADAGSIRARTRRRSHPQEVMARRAYCARRAAAGRSDGVGAARAWIPSSPHNDPVYSTESPRYHGMLEEKETNDGDMGRYHP